jgi:hypothetical protein
VGTFPKKKWAQIPRKISVSLLGCFFVVVGRIVRIRTVRTTSESGHENRDSVWHVFSRQISDFWLLFLGCTKQFVQLTVGMDFEVQNRAYNSTDLARITR